MNIINTPINDLYIIEPRVFADQRGYFFESFNQERFFTNNLKINFVQDNESKSTFGVVRGLHFQLPPFAQTKLVRVVQGEIFDVAVDLRKESSTFGNWFGSILSDENKKQLLIPKGFAHGFSVLSNTAIVFYKCDAYYNPTAERGIIFNDSLLNINWQLNNSNIIVSEKDKLLPNFKNIEI